MHATESKWTRHDRAIVNCTQCPRLITHCREVARVKRRAYRDEPYWGKPVPTFGDRRARIMILALAPGAHGANRTGRMFTGDKSGELLFGALYRAGLSTAPESVGRDDGLRVKGVFITNTCRCAPPGNKPSREEIDNCEPFLDREFELLDRLRVVLALGKIGWDAALRRARRVDEAAVPRPQPAFGHGALVRLRLGTGGAPMWLLGSYHPSRQNTQTGRLTTPMFQRVMRRAATLARRSPTTARARSGVRT